MSLARYLVAVVLGFVRSICRHAQVWLLLGCQFGHLNAKVVEMQPSDFLIELVETT